MLDSTSRSAYYVVPFSSEEVTAVGGQLSDPISIAESSGTLFVVNQNEHTIVEQQNADLWRSIASRATVTKSLNFDLSLRYGQSGFFFPQLTRPMSVTPYADFLYIVDNHALFAYLPSRDRLVRISYRKDPTSPERVAVSKAATMILIGEQSEEFRVWPLIVPFTVEIESDPDGTSALAALYTYLWDRGTLSSTLVTLPATTPAGAKCAEWKCLVESVRDLVPSFNPLMKALLCKMNPVECNGNKLSKNLLASSTVRLPDVPFEPYLAYAPETFDGKTSIKNKLRILIADDKLMASIGPHDIDDLNSMRVGDFDSIPNKGTVLQLPVQRNRYYLAVERSELYSSSSGFVSLVEHYPLLGVRPYGVESSGSAGGITGQNEAKTNVGNVVDTGAPSDLAIHNAADLVKIEADMLKHIGFAIENSPKYGRANDVPVLIFEASVDCQHPSFFGTAQDDHAFTGYTCTKAEQVTSPTYVDWTMTQSHHGTCVASLIGGRSSPFGPSLAPGADLNTIDSGSLTADTLKQFYRRERQPFIVNYSSGDPPVTEPQWRSLFEQAFIRSDVLFIAAADNDDDLLETKMKFPAYLAREYSNVISVGALDKTGSGIWEDAVTGQGSNTGRRVELLAPGENVPCAEEVSQSQAVYSSPAGTSFAAPIVSSVAALLMEKRLSPREVKARLLATADPVNQERLGQPYAVFGKLNMDRALLNPKLSHLDFMQNGNRVHLDADLSDGSNLKMQNPAAQVPVWMPIPIDYLLSIRKATGPGANNLFRLVMFNESDSGGTVELKDRVLLDGCLSAQSRDTGDTYYFVFGAGCLEASQLPDQGKVITDLQLLIAPTLGRARMQ